MTLYGQKPQPMTAGGAPPDVGAGTMAFMTKTYVNLLGVVLRGNRTPRYIFLTRACS